MDCVVSEHFACRSPCSGMRLLVLLIFYYQPLPVSTDKCADECKQSYQAFIKFENALLETSLDSTIFHPLDLDGVANTVCLSVEELDSCLAECDSFASDVSRKTEIPHKQACSEMRTINAQEQECRNSHERSLFSECGQQLHQMPDNIEAFVDPAKFARQLNELSLCFEQAYGKYCGQETAQIVRSWFNHKKKIACQMVGKKQDVPDDCDAVEQSTTTTQGTSRRTQGTTPATTTTTPRATAQYYFSFFLFLVFFIYFCF